MEKKLERTQIPDKFRSKQEKDAMLADLRAQLAREVVGSDKAMTLVNKLAKVRATTVARKPKESIRIEAQKRGANRVCPCCGGTGEAQAT